jgi:hypothetical protein
MSRFDEVKRERLLTLMEAGQTVEQACSDTGIGRATVTRWAAAGRKPGAPADVREFSRRYGELRRAQSANGNGNGNGDAEPLSDDELVAVLERAAGRGSAEAAKMLLSRRQRQERAAADVGDLEPPAEDSPMHPFRAQVYAWALGGDPFVAASPDELAELSPKQREHVLSLAAERGSA